MTYYANILKNRVKAAPRTLGTQLVRAAIARSIALKDIAALLGASKMTVYNWSAGRQVTNAYKPRVTQLIQILKAAPSNSAAWSTACQTFHPQAD